MWCGETETNSKIKTTATTNALLWTVHSRACICVYKSYGYIPFSNFFFYVSCTMNYNDHNKNILNWTMLCAWIFYCYRFVSPVVFYLFTFFSLNTIIKKNCTTKSSTTTCNGVVCVWRFSTLIDIVIKLTWQFIEFQRKETNLRNFF